MIDQTKTGKEQVYMSSADESREYGRSEETVESVPLLPHAGFSSVEKVQAQVSPFQEIAPLLVDLLATLSHEFRTPLTVILASTSTLLRQAQLLSSEEQRELLHMIQAAGKQLELLTARLLDLTQLEAGTFQLTLGLVDLPALAREAFTRAQRYVPEPLAEHFTFHLQCRDEAGNQTQELPLVKGDRRALHQVLDHLLENAIRFSPQGGRIDVIVRPAPQERTESDTDQPIRPSFLEICVCDFGLGIPPEELDCIFERFYRVDRRLTREVNGLGVGLTLCKYLMALHGGRIWAESCSAGGSAFHLWLPLEASLSVM